MKTLKILFVLLLSMMFSGCFEVNTDIFVNKDGSGKIVERVMISKEMMKEIQNIFGSFGAKNKKEEKIDIYDKDKLVKDAPKLGAGVKYVSSKKINSDTQNGYEVIYSFADINKLQLNQNPSDRSPRAKNDKGEDVRENISFDMKKGSPSVLIIHFPKSKEVSKKSDKKKSKTNTATPEQIAETGKLLKEMKMAMNIYPPTNVIKTDAEYFDGKKITLMEVNFGELVSNSKQLEEFTKKDYETFEDAKKFLKNIKGMKVETKDEIKVEF